MDRGAWCTTVHRVTESQTRLSTRARTHTCAHTGNKKGLLWLRLWGFSLSICWEQALLHPSAGAVSGGRRSSEGRAQRELEGGRGRQGPSGRHSVCVCTVQEEQAWQRAPSWALPGGLVQQPLWV